jgi:hypothetical protein
MNRNEESRRARKWIMTMQGMYAQFDIRAFVEAKEPEFDYIKIAQEIGEGGQPHLQGYFEVANKISLKGARKLWDFGGFVPSHLEIAWDPNKAQAYIGNLGFVHAAGEKKGGKVLWIFESGTFVPDKGEAKRQGRPWNDSLLEIKALVDGGASLYTLYQGYFLQMIYCGKAIAEYKGLVDFRKKFPELSSGDSALVEGEKIDKEVKERGETKFNWGGNENERENRE